MCPACSPSKSLWRSHCQSQSRDARPGRDIRSSMMTIMMTDFRQVMVPTVECEDVTDRTCVKLPNAEETTIDVTACVPVVDKPQCDKVVLNDGSCTLNLNDTTYLQVELVLPKQVCRELVYGYAEKPVVPVHQPYQHPYEHPQPTPYHHSKIKYVNKVHTLSSNH